MAEVQVAGITDPAIVRKHGLHDIANLLLNATQILTALSEGHTSEGEVEVPPQVIHDIQVLRRVVATLANIATSLKEGKEIVRKEVFNLGDWVSDVVHALNGPSTQFLNIEFDCPETVMIYADKTAIWRAVHNILKNAIDVLGRYQGLVGAARRSWARAATASKPSRWPRVPSPTSWSSRSRSPSSALSRP